MAAVLTHNITINKGATYRQVFVWSQGSPAVPVDVTTYTARMQVREDIDDVTPILDITTTPAATGDITLGTTDGLVTVFISDTTSTAITVDGGVYDLEMVAAGGDVTRLLEGAVVFTSEVTR